MKRKETYFKTHKLTKEERKSKKDRRRKAFKQIDLNAGFAKGHLTKDVAEAMGLGDLFKGGTQKKNLTEDKKKRALDKISRFTNKVAGEWVLPPRKGKETTLLKAKSN